MAYGHIQLQLFCDFLKFIRYLFKLVVLYHFFHGTMVIRSTDLLAYIYTFFMLALFHDMERFMYNEIHLIQFCICRLF